MGVKIFRHDEVPGQVTVGKGLILGLQQGEILSSRTSLQPYLYPRLDAITPFLEVFDSVTVTIDT